MRLILPIPCAATALASRRRAPTLSRAVGSVRPQGWDTAGGAPVSSNIS